MLATMRAPTSIGWTTKRQADIPAFETSQDFAGIDVIHVNWATTWQRADGALIPLEAGPPPQP